MVSKTSARYYSYARLKGQEALRTKKKDETSRKYDRIENASHRLPLVQPVEDFALSYTLCHDADDGEVLLLFVQPSSCLRSIGKSKESDDRQYGCDNALYSEEHPPASE
jgi:hypothetical protein